MPSFSLILLATLALLPPSLLAATLPEAPAEHYELQLRPDFDAQTLHGQARLRWPASRVAVDQLWLNAPHLQLLGARLAGQDLTPAQIVREAEGWRLTLPQAQPVGQSITLELSYRAGPGNGLVFGTQHVYTAYASCDWLPCAGPELSRATLTTTLTLPHGYRSVASGLPLPEQADQRQRWAERRPYPLYTLGFAAGAFHEAEQAVGASRLRYLGVRDEAADLLARFAPTPAMLAFLSSKAGLPLPQPRYTQVLVPGGAAQEVSGHAVIGKAMLDPILEDAQEDWVIVHELAHQWWGNWLTCDSWAEFWLNEGITSFMTAAWKQHRWGEAAYQRELQLAEKRWQRARDAGWDRPLSWPGDYPNLGMKRAIHYSKGLLFMVALRSELGEAAFWDGLKRYTRAGAALAPARGVRAGDLRRAMELAAGRSLQGLFDRWVD
ncbi:M1 family aminopeptidase [Paucibacter sp. APW11]|uniref:Aminopeptidase N n=1 Tax=Roseateles aquae TaxID=3077235 RepID=A0ABU3PE57_9BURK|nr:M1 family aminopeptidase [Paucibacter sp. APW11]MDT9000818.1 M1 family aminopeptidase [Paucibacter sp. APW11]